MNSSLLLSILSLLCFCTLVRNKNKCLADSTSLQDTCPTSMPVRQTVFMNGFPCKNPATIIASDFKTSRLNHAGDTDNFRRSSTSIVTAAEFPGLNTLGLSMGRTDIAVDGIVFPHAHPRASEMFFVSKGVVIAGFIDTRNQLFQKTLREGDVFVFPRGLLHFSLNAGYDLATIFSVLNSQNPGAVTTLDAMFEPGSDALESLLRSRLLSLSATAMKVDGIPA